MAKKHSWNNINEHLHINAKKTQKHLNDISNGKPPSGEPTNCIGNVVDLEIIDYDSKRKTMTLINGAVIRYKLHKSNIKGFYLSFVCNCGKSCASLYFADNGDLRCRKCLNLYYPSQMMAKGKKRDKAMALRVFISYENATKRYRNMVTRKGAMYYKAKEVLGI